MFVELSVKNKKKKFQQIKASLKFNVCSFLMSDRPDSGGSKQNSTKKKNRLNSTFTEFRVHFQP